MLFKSKQCRLSRRIIAGVALIVLSAMAGVNYQRSAANTAQATRIEIDVMPGESSKVIDATARSIVPVAMLTSVDFDATTVDPASVRLAGARTTKGKGAQWAHGVFEDANGDGRIDLIVYVSVYSLGLGEGLS